MAYSETENCSRVSLSIRVISNVSGLDRLLFSLTGIQSM